MDTKIEKEWVTESGLKARCVFVFESHRCGYVEIPKEHPLYDVPYNSEYPDKLKLYAEKVKSLPLGNRGAFDAMLIMLSGGELQAGMLFDVHGSVTYSGKLDTEDWWYGFDCAHCDDGSKHNPSYPVRTLEYVIQECENLAKQLTDCVKEQK